TDCTFGSGGYLFSCSDATTCQEVTAAGYYVNEGTKELYTCSGTSGQCSAVNLDSCESDDAYGPNILLDASSHKGDGNYGRLIKCKDGSGSDGHNSGDGVFSNSPSSSGGNTVTCMIMDDATSNGEVKHYITDIDIDDDTTGDLLITCSSGRCFIEASLGYFINNDSDEEDMIIQCELDEKENHDCFLLENADLKECKNAGEIIVDDNKKVSLCISDDSSEAMEIKSDSEVVEYVFINVEDKTFPGVTDPGNVCVRISGREGSVTMADNSICTGEVVKECEVSTGTNCIVETYYLIDPSTNKIISTGEGSLFYCAVENEACTKIVNTGIYIDDKDNIYSCQQDTCSKSGYDETACSASKTGRIIYKEENKSLSICINYITTSKKSVEIELSLSNNGYYVVAGSAGNIFTGNTEEYAIIKIDGQVITLDSKYKNNSKYIYANMSDNGKYKIMESKDSCPKNNNVIDGDNILELKCKNGICEQCKNDQCEEPASP
ncbi:hypothetical protein H8356DRAFT_929880, partial [Neocallimastix lanati (nom. inval.)]